MKKYLEWLALTCKWSTNGMNGDEFKAWNELTTELDKHCQVCEEGQICLSCHNTGLNLSIHEKMLVSNIENAIKQRRNNLHSEESMVN